MRGIAIALLGPPEIVDAMMRVVRAFPSLQPIAVPFERREDAERAIASVIGEVEVILVAGTEPVRKGEGFAAKPAVPVHYLPPSGAGLYRALLRLRHRGIAGPFSVDTLSRTAVERTFRELDLSGAGEAKAGAGARDAGTGGGAGTGEAIVFDGPVYASTEELVRFHEGLYREGRTAAALTGVKAAAERLEALGIPAEWVAPLDQDITVALERALLSTETRRVKEAQIVVGLIHVDEFDRIAASRPSEHDVQRLKLDIHRTLLDYVESLDGYLTHLGSSEYLFFTTRGAFERGTGGYKSVPVAREARHRLNVTLSIGIGFGQTANEAGTHARMALGHAKAAGGNSCFIVREDRTLIGPLAMADPVEYDLSLTDKHLLEKAEAAGMTRTYIARLMNWAARRGRLEYNVQELAEALGITVRSTHRLLLDWTDAGLIEVAGMEKVGRGRPRQRFRLAFLADRIKDN